MDHLDPAYQNHVKKHLFVALALGLLTVIMLLITAPDIGLTWDEPAYITASESCVEWFKVLKASPGKAFQADIIEKYWRPNSEHPPLDKIWSGLIWQVSKKSLDDLTAHRLGNILLVGALAVMLYLLVARHYGGLAGLMAVLFLMTLPRFFVHAHMAALDMPATVASFASVFAFWLLKDRPGLGWDFFMGLVWGLALATKVNTVFVPPMLFLWMMLFQRRWYLFRRLCIMGGLAILVFLAVWPYLYDKAQFWPRLQGYIGFITDTHWKIGQYYRGRVWMPPPWHFPFVMTLAVVPLTMALTGLMGFVHTVTNRVNRSAGILFVICALIPMAALAFSGSMVYDNDRLFITSFPYIAALAGIGFHWIQTAVPKLKRLHRFIQEKKAGRYALAGTLVILALAPQVISAASQYPHLLSYYSETIGGLPGATRLGLETTYWCETYASALPYLNAHAQPGDVIWVTPASQDVLLYYQREGLLREDVSITWDEGSFSVFEDRQGVVVNREDADWALVQYRQTGFNEALLAWKKEKEPVFRVAYRGIPLMEIYKKDKAMEGDREDDKPPL